MLKSETISFHYFSPRIPNLKKKIEHPSSGSGGKKTFKWSCGPVVSNTMQSQIKRNSLFSLVKCFNSLESFFLYSIAHLFPRASSNWRDVTNPTSFQFPSSTEFQQPKIYLQQELLLLLWTHDWAP